MLLLSTPVRRSFSLSSSLSSCSCRRRGFLTECQVDVRSGGVFVKTGGLWPCAKSRKAEKDVDRIWVEAGWEELARNEVGAAGR